MHALSRRVVALSVLTGLAMTMRLALAEPIELSLDVRKTGQVRHQIAAKESLAWVKHWEVMGRLHISARTASRLSLQFVAESGSPGQSYRLDGVP